MEFIYEELPGHFSTDMPLHSRYILVLLELWHGARSCIKIYPFCGKQRIHVSLYFTIIIIDAIVVFGANRMRNIMLSVFILLFNR